MLLVAIKTIFWMELHFTVFQIMMMGSLEASVEEAQRIPDDLPPVINDLDIEEEEVAIENRSEYLQKVNL